jgi:hypothetical protein
MKSEFDPYREALVMETVTVWSASCEHIAESLRAPIESRLHAEPEKAAQLVYIRMHTGFCRQITVTEQDLARLG